MQLAKRAEAGIKGGQHMPGGFKLYAETGDRPRIYDRDIFGSCILQNERPGMVVARKVVMLAKNADSDDVLYPHTVKRLDLRRQENVHLGLAGLTTNSDEDDSWCWH